MRGWGWLHHRRIVFSAARWSRTTDTRLFRPLLYRLSYRRFLFSGRMMGFEPMTKGATILYSTNWATISIFVPSKESNLHTYNVFLYLLSRVIMIQYHEDASYCSAASPIYALNRHFVGREGLEPPVSNESGFTVRAATNYRLPPHYFVW